MSGNVTVIDQYVLGPEGIPFFTKEWTTADPKAYVVFVHGFAEHIERYDDYFRRLAAHDIHILAFDQRGAGRTSQAPLDAKAPEVEAWRKEGKTVHVQKAQKGVRSGGWLKALPDIEFFVKRESERAQGKPLFLYGHSMGGGLSLGFATRIAGVPAESTLKLLTGVIISGPFIRSTTPQSVIQIKAGTLAANLGLGNFCISAPLDIKELTHNEEVQEKTKNDPWCEPVGSLRTLADMLSYGAVLDSKRARDAWPKDLPLLLYHGEEDKICCPKASAAYIEGCAATDKTHKLLPGLYHEPQNEVGSAPQDLADFVGDWVIQRTNRATQAKL